MNDQSRSALATYLIPRPTQCHRLTHPSLFTDLLFLLSIHSHTITLSTMPGAKPTPAGPSDPVAPPAPPGDNIVDDPSFTAGDFTLVSADNVRFRVPSAVLFGMR